jgi:hypothetical protein
LINFTGNLINEVSIQGKSKKVGHPEHNLIATEQFVKDPAEKGIEQMIIGIPVSCKR